MARPTRAQVEERRLGKVFGQVRDRISETSAKLLTVREMVFARLVAEEGMTHSDAYREAYEPKSAKDESIHQMASRIANKTRVKLEIERIKTEIKEDAMKREERLAIALDGEKVRGRMAMELFAMATSDASVKERNACWKTLGSMRHVNAFETQTANQVSVNFGISSDQNAGQARQSLQEKIRGMISSRSAQRTIEGQVLKGDLHSTMQQPINDRQTVDIEIQPASE